MISLLLQTRTTIVAMFGALSLVACGGGGGGSGTTSLQPSGPQASFTASPVSGSTPLTVNFNDTSTRGGSAITSWAWTFGDGATSSQQNPSHTYTAVGTYTVDLTVSSSSGQDTYTSPGLISAGSTANSQPKCVYNQAYQENYAADSLSNILASASDCYVLVDPLIDGDTSVTNAIPNIKANNNEVGCYISSGTGENYRSDFSELQPYLTTRSWPQFPDEYFVDDTVGAEPIMRARIDLADAAGCDWIEFDNMDWAFDPDNVSQFNLNVTEAQAETYNQNLCAYAQSRGMMCMAKNTRQGASSFDGITFESYDDDLDWWPDSHLSNFLAEDKLGLIVHYDEPNCSGVYTSYQATYGSKLSFICEGRSERAYLHFNE